MQGKTCDSLKCSSMLRLLQFSALLQAAAIIHSKILPWLFRDHVLLLITSVSLKNKREVLPIFSHKLIHLTVKFFFHSQSQHNKLACNKQTEVLLIGLASVAMSL